MRAGPARKRRLLADSVEKVENRTVPKISRKLILNRLDRCDAPIEHESPTATGL
jgi:hypothetical protein